MDKPNKNVIAYFNSVVEVNANASSKRLVSGTLVMEVYKYRYIHPCFHNTVSLCASARLQNLLCKTKYWKIWCSNLTKIVLVIS